MARTVTIFLPEVLDRVAHGGKISSREAQVAAESAAAVRNDFLKDAFEALREVDPGSLEFQAFKKCLRSMGETLTRHGIVSVAEMQQLWIGIEMLE